MAARAGLTRFYEALKAADETLARYPVPDKLHCEVGREEREIYDLIEMLEDRFCEAMDDDFNTALAIGHLFEAVRGMNRIVGTQRFDDCPLSLAVLRDARNKLSKLGDVLGLFGSDPAAWLDKEHQAALAGSGLTPEDIEALIAERQQARKNRDFARADAIRDELAAKERPDATPPRPYPPPAWDLSALCSVVLPFAASAPR